MIPEDTMRRWKEISEQYHYNTVAQFIMAAVEFYINSL